MGAPFNKACVRLVFFITLSVLVNLTQSLSVDKLLRQCLSKQSSPMFLSQKGTFKRFINKQSRMEFLYQRFFD